MDAVRRDWWARHFRPPLLAVLALLVGACGAAAECPSSEATPIPSASPTTETSLVVNFDGQKSPRFSATSALHLPVACPALAQATWPPESKAEVQPLLSCLAWEVPDDQESALESRFSGFAGSTVNDDVASLTFRSEAMISTAPEVHIGPWSVKISTPTPAAQSTLQTTTDDHKVDETAYGESGEAPSALQLLVADVGNKIVANVRKDLVITLNVDQLPTQHLDAKLCSSNAEQASVQPPPNSDDGSGTLTWLSSGPPSRESEEVRITPSLLTQLRLTIDADIEIWRLLRLIVGFLVPAIVLPLMLLALPHRPKSSQPSVSPDAVRLAWMTIIGALVLVAGANIVITSLSWRGDNALAHALPIVSVAGLAVIVLRSGDWRRVLPVIATVLVTVWFVLRQYLTDSPGVDRLLQSDPPGKPIPLGLAAFLALSATVLTGVWLWGCVAAALPKPAFSTDHQAPNQLAHPNDQGGFADSVMRLRIPIVLSITFIVVLLFGQWTLSQYSDYSETAKWGSEAGDFWMGWLPLHYSNYPILLLRALSPLIPFVGLVSLFAVFRAAGPHARGVSFTPEESWIIRSLIIVFAAFVVGTRGDYLGFAVPLAFLVALLFLRFYIPWSMPLRRAEGGSPVTNESAILQGRTWWSDGVGALHIGGQLAILPLTYFAYVLWSRGRLSELLSRSNAFGALELAIIVLGELAFWLVAAFVLGALYTYLPGSNGVLKALFLAVVFLVARGSSLLLIADVDETNWTVRVFQLTLFLIVVGLSIDRTSLKSGGISWTELAQYYQLSTVRTIVAFVVPFGLAVLEIIRQLESGQAAQAITTFTSHVPDILPPLPLP